MKKSDMAGQREERVEVNAPVIQERKEGGAKGGRKIGKKEANNSISKILSNSVRYFQCITYVRRLQLFQFHKGES